MKRSLCAVGTCQEAGPHLPGVRKERALLDPTFRSPQFQAKVWVVGWGAWCESPTTGLALRLGPGGISAAAGERVGLSGSVKISLSRFTAARRPRKTLLLCAGGKHQERLSSVVTWDQVLEVLRGVFPKLVFLTARNCPTVLWLAHLSQPWGWNQVGPFGKELELRRHIHLLSSGAMMMFMPVWLLLQQTCNIQGIFGNCGTSSA